jgi:Glycosyltransferase family 87
MALLARRVGALALVGIGSAWLTTTTSGTGDWTVDSWPAVSALGHGDVHAFLSAKAMMGPFATLVQAPFAAIAGGGPIETYPWASFPCLLAAGLLGIYLARIAARRGASNLFQFIFAALCLVNPLTVAAIQSGHPEEILTASLAIGAIATAAEGHGWRTAILLGLAVASKQWAVIAILPALLALPRERIRVGLGAGAIVVAFMLPGIVVAPEAFSEVNHNAADTGRVVTPWSVWYPIADEVSEEVQIGDSTETARVHEAPSLVGTISHPLIVLLAFALPIGLVAKRRRLSLTGADAMALFALLALLRCALDPVDNVYYHLPLLLALVGWDALDRRAIPVRSLAGASVALVFWDWSHHLTDVPTLNAAYLTVIAIAGLLLAAALFTPSLSRQVGTSRSQFRRWRDGPESSLDGLGRRA